MSAPELTLAVGLVEIRAPVKVNLTLDVGPLRPDGFHEIDSLVVKFGPVGDDLKVQVRESTGAGGAIRLIVKDRRPEKVAVEPMPRGPENLAHRAAAAFVETLRATGAEPLPGRDLWINLSKVVPAQAGLGAGSADAAAVLLALNGLLTTPLSPDELAQIASGLGSDVALFLSGGPVRMRGRGERIEPVSAPLPELHGVLVRPESGVPTGPAYAALDRITDRAPGKSTEKLLDAIAFGELSPTELATRLHNDFEDAVSEQFPDVARALEFVRRAGALRALLCGSGSSVFVLATDRAHALQLTKAVAPQFPWVKLVKSVA